MEGEPSAVADEVFELGAVASPVPRKNSLRQRISSTLKTSGSKTNILDEDEKTEERDVKSSTEHRSAYYTAIRMAPLMAILGVVSSIARPVQLELIKRRVCENSLNFTGAVCLDLSNRSHQHEAKAVQAGAAQLKIYESVIEAVPAIIFSLFVGPWSDQYGRKLPMLIPFFGKIMGYALAVLFSYVSVSPSYLLITPAIVSMTGGEMLVHAATFSYIADFTTPETRSPNIALIDGLSTLMRGAGTALGGVLQSQYGLAVPFIVVVCLDCCAFLYVVIFIHDSKQHKSFKEAKLLEMFSPARLKESWHSIVRKRPGNNRLYLSLVFVTVILAGAIMIGDMSVMQLFLTGPPFFWSLLQYTTYSTVVSLSEAVVMVLVTIGLRRFINVPDSLLGFIAGCSAVASLVGLGVSQNTWMIYVAAAVGLCRMMSLICVRSLMIGFVDADETGKVMSAMHSVFSVVPMIGVQIFTNVFMHTTDWWSGFCFVLGAILMSPSLAVFLYIFIMQRREKRKELASTKTLDVKV